MKKYLALMVVTLGLSFYISIQDESTSQKGAQEAARLRGDTPTAAANEPTSQSDIEKAKRNSPSWYTFFRWPEGAGSVALILTLLTIAEQTEATRKSAETAGKQIALTVNGSRPRLRLEPQPYESIINEIPHVEIRVTNIGGSKAIFGLCLCGMEVCGIEEVFAKKENKALMNKLTSRIIDPNDHWDERIIPQLGSVVFPDGFDKSKPYKLHIYGILNFRDTLFEDSWVREFHYVMVVVDPNAWFPQVGKRAAEFWMPLMGDEDKRREPPCKWKDRRIKIMKIWKGLEAWAKKIESED